MDITERFAQHWLAWDERVHDRDEAAAYLRTAKDEDLLELLAGSSPKDRKYERDVVTTELQNRLAGRHMAHPRGADEVLVAAQQAYEAAAGGQKAIHTAEAILKASGDVELGTSVSTAAYISLDTTKVALEAARSHAAELQAALTQSRIAERLLEDAAQAARDVLDKAAAGAKRVAELGHVAEAEAARKAAELIRVAADIAAQKLREGRARYGTGYAADAEVTLEAAELVRAAAVVAVQKLREGRERDGDGG